MQSLLLTFNKFHILFYGYWLCVIICLLGKVFKGFKQQQWFFASFPSKQIHAQSQQQKP